MSISQEMLETVTARLGREPRGLVAVSVVDDMGEPMVIEVAALVDGKPFPTLFWLIDPAICYRIDQVEAGGLIARFQAQIDADPSLQASLNADHLAYIALRNERMSQEVCLGLEKSGYAGVLDRRGVGGIADFTRIRCLHTWYGAHLVVPNTVGKMLDQWWDEQAVS